MEPFSFGTFPFVIIWWCVLATSHAQYREMVCESVGTRQARQMTEPGPECDMSHKNWCIEKTSNYPEEMIMEAILDNRGVMKRLFGDQREARFLEYEFSNNVDDTLQRPPPLWKPRIGKKRNMSPVEPTKKLINGKFPNTEILSSSRLGKKIVDDDRKEMNVILIDDSVEGKLKEEESISDDETDPIDDTETTITETIATTSSPPSRPNDKVFDSAFDTELNKTQTTTTQTNISIQNEVTESTLSQDDFSTERVTTMIDLEDINDVGLETVATLPVLGETSPQITTSATLSNRLISTTSEENIVNSVQEQNMTVTHTQTLENTSTDPTVFQKVSSSVSTDVPLPDLTSLKNSLPSNLDEVKNIKEESKESIDFLEGRVQFETKFSTSFTGNQENRLRKPTYTPQRRPQPVRGKPPLQRERTEQPLVTSSNTDSYKGPSNNIPAPTISRPPMEKFAACNSTSEFIAPTWAQNIHGKNLIVVNVGSFMQHLHIEECEKNSLYRKMFCQRGCRCEQKFRFQKLLVIDPDDECKGIFSEWFRFPSCCVCTCYSTGMNHDGDIREGRFMEQGLLSEHEDYFDEDLDFSDPFVRHYFSLDQENDENNEADLKSTASLQEHQFSLFSDMNSVDTSIDLELSPSRNEKKNQNWSSKSNHFGEENQKITNEEHLRSWNSSHTYSTPKKKSRLLFPGLNHSGSPQIPPRIRIPMSRAAIPGGFPIPWPNPPYLSFWPSPPLHGRFSSLRVIPPRSLAKPLTRFYEPSVAQFVTPSTERVEKSTLGTLDAATPPFYKWNHRAFVEKSATKTKSSLLNRIPREAT